MFQKPFVRWGLSRLELDGSAAVLYYLAGSAHTLPMIGDEARVVAAFSSWLASQGWSVRHEIEYVDVLAERDGVTLRAEAKGRTTSVGLDVDTLYGQLLRRMPASRSDSDLFAVVVPAEAIAAATRVPEWVTETLGIRIYAVDAADTVLSVR